MGQANKLNKILNFFAMWLHAILSITKGSAKSNVVDGRRNSGRDIQWDQSQSEVPLAFISVLSSWKNLMKTKVYPPLNFFPATLRSLLNKIACFTIVTIVKLAKYLV